MLNVFGGRFGTCDGVSRRSFLRVGALGIAGLALPDVLKARALAAKQGDAPRNTAVIQVFLSGGPTHLETYDLKPDAPKEFRGDFKPDPHEAPRRAIKRVFPPPGPGHGQDRRDPQPASRLGRPRRGDALDHDRIPLRVVIPAHQRPAQRRVDRRQAPRAECAGIAPLCEHAQHAHLRERLVPGGRLQPIQRGRRPQRERPSRGTSTWPAA